MRRGPRTGSPLRIDRGHSRLVEMFPDLLPVRQAIGDDRFAVFPLLLSECKISDDGERRPRSSDRMPPNLLRRPRFPVGSQLHAANDSVASSSTKPRPVRFVRNQRFCNSIDWSRRLELFKVFANFLIGAG